jgi:hypothetical protein
MYGALQHCLQVACGHAGKRDAIVVTEINYGVAVKIRSDQRLQLRHGMRVGEAIELNRVVLWIKVSDGLRTYAWRKDKAVRAWATD